MRLRLLQHLLAIFSFGVLSAPVFALGPIDGELTFNYWDAELTAAGGASDNTVETGFVHADLWFFDNFGLQGEWIDKDVNFDLSNESANVISTRKNLLLRYRLASFSDNNFIALGGGVEELEFKESGSVIGPKIDAQWRVGLPLNIYAYARAAIVPSYEDTQFLDNLSSFEYEAALNITPFPLMNLRAGYRAFKLDFDGKAQNAGDGNDFQGLFIGVGVHF